VSEAAPFTIDVVLPALDEEQALPGVLAALPHGYRPIVVDNGSSDGTASVARDHGALVIDEPLQGFGRACWAGLAAAESDIVCFMDADGSFDPAELPLVSGPVEAGQCDLVLGAREPLPGSWPLHARVANRALAFELRRRTGLALHDLGPMRAAPRKDLMSLGITDRRSGWPLEMVLLAHHARWRIAEQPITYRPRVGQSKVTGTIRGTARAVSDMSRILRTRPAGPAGAAGATGQP
jgi:glycosyltransferase involved in cell wall biosynthesis